MKNTAASETMRIKSSNPGDPDESEGVCTHPLIKKLTIPHQYIQ